MSCIVDSAATYIMVVKFRNTIWPPPSQFSVHIGELRRQAIQTEHGPYIAERTQKQSILWNVYAPNPLPPYIRIRGSVILTAQMYTHKEPHHATSIPNVTQMSFWMYQKYQCFG
jgi:hypothetical protein